MSVVVGTAAAGLLLVLTLTGIRPRRRSLLHPAAGNMPVWPPPAAARVVTAAGGLLRPPDPLSPTTDMVAFLDAVARGLRGGAGLHAAIRSAVRTSGVHAAGLAGLVGSLDAGVPLGRALAGWRGSRPSTEVSLAAAVLGFGLATGGSVARAVDGAAATLREHLALSGEVRVLATQARASAIVVGGAPLAFTAVVVLADPRVAGVLFGSLIGLVCLIVGAALELACVMWMRRLVARAAER